MLSQPIPQGLMERVKSYLSHGMCSLQQNNILCLLNTNTNNIPKDFCYREIMDSECNKLFKNYAIAKIMTDLTTNQPKK